MNSHVSAGVLVRVFFGLVLAVLPGIAFAGECTNWRVLHPEWIFCDDFENSDPLVGPGRYFEYDDNVGDFTVVDGVGVRDSRGMRARWQAGEVNAGGLKLGFGRNPSSYMNSGIRSNEDFREIYYRMYLKMQSGWQGSTDKLSRAIVIARDDWSEGAIAHLWGDGKSRLAIDPAGCVDSSNNVACVGYNDFAHLSWLGAQSGSTPIFDANHADRWYCIEAHVKLNDPGQSNGIQEFWIDGKLEARKANLNFVRSYNGYAINALFFENFWNAGAPQQEERYFDNIVVSTQAIGPEVQNQTDTPPPAPRKLIILPQAE